MKKIASLLFILSLTLVIFFGLLYVRENYFLKKTVNKTLVSTYDHVPLLDSFPVYPSKITKQEYPYLRPSFDYTHTFAREDGSLIYKVHYVIDGAGYRNSDKIRLKKTSRHLLMVGCSLVFGLGLPNADTLPTQLGNEFPNTAVYNLGLPGSGPHDHLKLFTDYPLRDYISQPEGAMVMVYFPDHYSRANQDLHYFDWAEPYRPVFGLVDSKIKYSGLLKDQKRWKEYNRIKKVGFSRSALEVAGLTNDVTPEKIKFTALLIKEVNDKYLKAFPKGKFYFLVLPHTYPYDETTQQIVSELKSLEVKVVPYADMAKEFEISLPPGKTSPYVIGPEEGHPSAFANEKLAKVLANWLRNEKAMP